MKPGGEGKKVKGLHVGPSNPKLRSVCETTPRRRRGSSTKWKIVKQVS